MKQILKTGILAAVLLSGCVYRYSEGDMQEGISIQVFNRASGLRSVRQKQSQSSTKRNRFILHESQPRQPGIPG